jgi:hypothetical protein
VRKKQLHSSISNPVSHSKNAFIEQLNRAYRDKVLNLIYLKNLKVAREKQKSES